MASRKDVKGKGSPYSTAECRVPGLIQVLGSQPEGDISHKPGGRLPLLSARPTVTLATLKMAAANFASGGHTGGASGAVHQGPLPLGAHQRGPDSNFFEKLTLSSAESSTMTSFIKAQCHLLLHTLMTSLIASRHSCCQDSHSVHCLRTI